MKNFKKLVKHGSLLMAVILCSSCLTGFKYYDGFGNVHLDSEKTIFNGVKYREQIGINPQNGMEKAYMVEVEADKANVKPIVFTGAVRSTASLGEMVSYAEKSGYKVVAAINGDIYDTKSGTPRGLVMHGGNIVTSGYASDRVVVFDKNGKASMTKDTLSYSIKGELAYQEGEEWIQREFKSKIDFVNVPFGAARGLHLYNRHYSDSTKTTGGCMEVVIDCGSTDNTQLRVGSTIKGTVKAVNVDVADTPIGENEIVLSTPTGSDSASKLFSIVPGSTVEIGVEDAANGKLAEGVEALGIYYSILEEGNVVTTGKNLNPRTAIGIKPNGSLLLYALDGRQEVSKGLNMVELANHMKSLGCNYAFNMDGGGSTTFYARLAGKEDKAGLRNIPSGGKERKIANSLLITYSGNGSTSVQNLNLYPANVLMMPGAQVEVKSYGSNELYEKVSLNGRVSYEIEGNIGRINDSGLYTAGEEEGKVKIVGRMGDISGDTNIQIVKKGLSITASVSKIMIKENEKLDINLKAKSGPVPVISNDTIFTWTCDENVGTVDEHGVFTAGAKGAEKGYVYASYGDYKLSIPVQVGNLFVEFSDTKEHWARQYIGELAARGVINGMGDNLYVPEGKLTRAQFLALLAKSMDGLNVTEAPASQFVDVPKDEWYYNYVNWGFANGIVNGVSETEFAPNDNITREQMCVMLCKFAVSRGIQLEQTGDTVSFSDQGSISFWALDYVMTVAGAGLINGQPEGNFEPQGLATRAQAAKVIHSFMALKSRPAEVQSMPEKTE